LSDHGNFQPASAERLAFQKDRAAKQYCAPHGVPYFTVCQLCVLVDIKQILNALAIKRIHTKVGNLTVEEVTDSLIDHAESNEE